MAHIHRDQPPGGSAPVTPLQEKEIGVLKGMAFAVLYENDPGFELGLAITAVALIAIGALLNLMGAHPGVLSHVGTIGLKVVESAAFATGIFFASTLILRHFLKAIGEGGWIAEIRSDQIANKAPLGVASEFSEDDALLSTYDPRIGQSLPQFIPGKFTFKILGNDATLYGVYSKLRIEDQLQVALKEATSLDDIPDILEQILQETDCNVALKIGSEVFVSAQKFLHVYTDKKNFKVVCDENALSGRKQYTFDIHSTDTEVLILGAPSTMSLIHTPEVAEIFSQSNDLKGYASELQTLMQRRNQWIAEQQKQPPDPYSQVQEKWEFGDVTLAFINLARPLESSS